MDNNIENKAKFFAQYWDVPCINDDNWIWRNDDKFSDLPFGTDLSNAFAKLIPLSSISDDDLEYICRLLGYQNTPEGLALVKRWLSVLWKDYDDLSFYAISDTKPTITVLTIVDYLRSKRYALTALGKSVEELIGSGWVKLDEIQ